MIDKENEVFTRVYERVVAEFPSVAMDTSYQAVPSGFPHVSLYQMDSYTPRDKMDNSVHPKYVAITFEAQVYTNKVSNKKAQAKKIMAIINDVMEEMNLRRIILTPTPNLNDASIYRLTARFEGMADANYFYGR